MDDRPSSDAPPSGHYGYHGHHHRGGRGATAGSHDVTDPVCGTVLDPHTTEHRVERQEKWYYFCSARCQAIFEAAPERYAG